MARVDKEINHAVTKLRHYRVEHSDVRPPNVPWNSEGENIMLVDFQRSKILKRVPPLQDISLNLKRMRDHLNEGVSCGYLSSWSTTP
jgi:hypothetical protein